MIQRIQSLYLLAVAILSSITLFLPWASFIDTYSIYYNFSYEGLLGKAEYLALNTWVLTVVAAIVPILALISIFLYKKRILQIRFCRVNLLLSAAFYALFAVYFYMIAKMGMKTLNISIILVFPLINMIFTYLAIRAIRKDEDLVRSVSRLR